MSVTITYEKFLGSRTRMWNDFVSQSQTFETVLNCLRSSIAVLDLYTDRTGFKNDYEAFKTSVADLLENGEGFIVLDLVAERLPLPIVTPRDIEAYVARAGSYIASLDPWPERASTVLASTQLFMQYGLPTVSFLLFCQSLNALCPVSIAVFGPR